MAFSSLQHKMGPTAYSAGLEWLEFSISGENVPVIPPEAWGDFSGWNTLSAPWQQIL